MGILRQLINYCSARSPGVSARLAARNPQQVGGVPGLSRFEYRTRRMTLSLLAGNHDERNRDFENSLTPIQELFGKWHFGHIGLAPSFAGSD